MKYILALLVSCFLGMSALAQPDLSPILNIVPTNTDSFYNEKEMVVEVAPTTTSASLFSPKMPRTYGYSIELESWVNTWAGTGIEFGSYNIKNYQLGLFDHLSIMQDFRFCPFENTPVLKRYAMGVKTGAETYFENGSKDMVFGFESYWTFSHSLRLEADIMQHISSNPQYDFQTARVALQFIF